MTYFTAPASGCCARSTARNTPRVSPVLDSSNTAGETPSAAAILRREATLGLARSFSTWLRKLELTPADAAVARRLRPRSARNLAIFSPNVVVSLTLPPSSIWWTACGRTVNSLCRYSERFAHYSERIAQMQCFCGILLGTGGHSSVCTSECHTGSGVRAVEDGATEHTSLPSRVCGVPCCRGWREQPITILQLLSATL